MTLTHWAVVCGPHVRSGHAAWPWLLGVVSQECHILPQIQEQLTAIFYTVQLLL